MATDEIKQTIVIEANIAAIQNDIKTLENQFKTSFANIGSSGIQSFASIDAASRKFAADSKATAAITATAVTTSGLKNISTLAAIRPGAIKSDAAEFARFEKVRQDALIASRAAFKEFEDSIRGGSTNITANMAASAIGTNKLNSSMDGLLATAKSLGLVLSVGFAVNFAKEALDATGQLNDLADQTGFTAETLLKLKPIANDAGSSIEEFAKSVNLFQKAIVDGSPSTVEALHKIGLTANELLKFSNDPEGLIGKLSKGFASVADQATRVQVQRDLLSRGGPKLAAAFAEIEKRGGIQSIAGEPSVISNEQIAAIDHFGRVIDETKIKLQALISVKFVGLLESFAAISDAVQKLNEGPLGKLVSIIEFFNKNVSVQVQGLDEKGLEKLGQTLGKPFTVSSQAIDVSKLEPSQRQQVVANFPAPKAPIDLSKATFGAPSELTKPSVGPQETDAQRDFKKSLDETIESLNSQRIALTGSKEAAIANAAKILENKAANIDLDKSNADLVKRLEEFKKISLEIAQGQFADQLTRQNQSLQIQITSLTHGKQAADELALSYEIANAKLGNMGEAARKAAETQKVLNQRLAEAVVPQIQNTLESDSNRVQLKAKEGDLSTNLAALSADALQKASDALDELIANKFTSASVKKLAIDAKLIVTPQLDDRKLDAIKEQVLIDFTLAERKADVLNKVFGNSFDETAAKIEALKSQLENALKVDRGADKTPQAHEAVLTIGAKLDQAQLDKAFEDINRQLEVADAQAVIFGRSFDLAGARVQAVEGNVNELLTRGLKPSTEDAKQLGEQLRNLKVANIFSDLRKNLEDISADAEILGGSIDLPSETVDALTDALKRLRSEGFGPLSPEIQRVKDQLEDAKAAERFAEAFQGIGRSALDSLQDLADGAKLKDVAKRLASNVNRAITDALITKPFEEWIKKQTNDLFGGILKLPNIPGAGTGQSVGIPGAVGQVAGATEIQAVATASTVGIQSTLGVAQTTITTLGATTEASISALQAVAITAIQAAAGGQSLVSAGQGASAALTGGAKVGSLFSGGSTGAIGSTSLPVGTAGSPSIEEAALLKAAGATAVSPAAQSAFSAAGSSVGGFFSDIGKWFGSFFHEGGTVGRDGKTRRLHGGGAVGPAIDLSRVSHFHAGGIIGPQISNHSNLQSTALRFHQGGAVKTAVTDNSIHSISRFHAGGAIGPAINSVQLSHVAHSNLARFHTGGAIGPTTNNSSHLTNITTAPRFHQGGIVIEASKFHGGGSISPSINVVARFHQGGIISPAAKDRGGDVSNVAHFHTGGSVNSSSIQTFSKSNPSNVARETLPRFHDGGELKAGERMIIAEDGEFMLNKRESMKLGREKLEKLNRGEATITPRFHFGGAISPAINVVQLSRIAPRFHFGGTIQAFSNTVAPALARFHNGGIIASTHVAVNPQLKFPRFHQGGAVLRSALVLPKYHDGGTVSSTERWSGTSADLSYMKQTGTISDAWMIPAGTPRGQNNGPTANIAVFNNPQFQNRQAVGQTSAQLAAAMEAGKRNR